MTVGDLKISQSTVVSPPAYIDRFVTPVINSLFGFDADGLPVTVTLGANLTLVGNILSATGGGGGGSGTVTSVSVGDLAPLFTSSVATPTVAAAVTFALSTQTANRVFAGPTTGSAAAPTFRALVAADIPNLTSIYATVGAIGSSGLTMNTARLLGRGAGGVGAIEEIQIGSGLSFAGGVLSTTDAGGTVTSVSITPANGITGTVTDPTTTPAITIILGAITPTSVNGLTITTSSGTLTITNGKTLSISNTLAFAGTDGSTLNVGSGGTLGTAAFTAASAYEVPLTFSTGLTRSTNTVTVNTSQNIAKLSNLTGNGFVKTSGGDGTLSIDTSTYLTSNQTITLSGDATGTGATAITVAVVKINGVSLADLSTGILKNTTITGAPSIAVAGDFPTLNQNTTGSAGTLATPRAIYGNNFDGSAALTQIIGSTFGGTGNGFTKFSGPTSAERTFTLPNVSATILTDNALITGAQGGTGVNNTGKTITLGGNFALSGAFASTFTVTAITTVTFPTTGTLATLAGAESLTNKKLGSLTSNGFVTTTSADGTLVVTNSAAFTSGTLSGLTGLALRDTSAAFDLTVAATSSTALTAGRTLTLDVVNAARTVKLTGNPTLADWFDQSVKTTDTPTFNRLLLNTTADYTSDNEFVVGDNPSSGRLASGTGKFQARAVGSDAKIRIQTIRDTGQSYLAFDRARGTTFGGTTALLSGTVFGSVAGVGNYGDSATYAHGPEIALETTENWSSTNRGSAVRIYGVAAGSTTQVTVAYFTPDGSTINQSVLVGASSLDGDVTAATGTPKFGMVANNNTSDAFVCVANGNNAIGAHMYGFKTRSTGTDANTVLQDGDEVFTIGGWGADGAAYRFGGGITQVVDGTPSSSCPTKLQFKRGGGTLMATMSSAGFTTVAAIVSGTTISTAAPAGASAGLWKLGSLVTGLTLTANLTQAVYIDIGGTVYKLLTAS